MDWIKSMNNRKLTKKSLRVDTSPIYFQALFFGV